MSNNDFLSLDDRLSRLGCHDPLMVIHNLIDWNFFEKKLASVFYRDLSVGTIANCDILVIFKILLLQQLYRLSATECENQLQKRENFARFVGLSANSPVPSAKLTAVFREMLCAADMLEELFTHFDVQLNTQGYQAQKTAQGKKIPQQLPKSRKTPSSTLPFSTMLMWPNMIMGTPALNANCCP